VQCRQEGRRRVVPLDVVQTAQRDHGHARLHEVGRDRDGRRGGAVARDGAARVVRAVGCFGGEGPGGFVAGSGVYSAEEDGVESKLGVRWGPGGGVMVGW
jgi:hypothetical protein